MLPTAGGDRNALLPRPQIASGRSFATAVWFDWEVVR